MSLEYEQTTNFEILTPVLEDYADWFGNIALCVAYSDAEELVNKIENPVSFKEWYKAEQENKNINPVIIENVKKSHDEMVEMGSGLIKTLKSHKKPALENFIAFKDLYNGFLSSIRRLEIDTVIEGSSIEEETGLRNPKSIELDIKKEIDRLSRQGSPFSLVATRIDMFAGVQNQKDCLKVAVENIKKCMRSFDDAYYLGNGGFLLSLKHADMIGAQAAVLRLQTYLKEDENNIEDITMSYCMSEPVSDEEVLKLLNEMNQDLIKHMNEKDVVLKFIEMSELERFVKSKV